MHLLLTRPRTDSEALAGELTARGHSSLIEPMLAIDVRAGPETLDLQSYQAVLLSSRYGAAALAARSECRRIRILAVSDATAQAVREEGFGQVDSAGGDAAALADLVRELLAPADGPLLHATGVEVAGDLAGVLRQARFEVDRQVLYATTAAVELSAAARAALSDGTLDGVLFFSPGTGRTFVHLVRAAALERHTERLSAYCLSANVAAALDGLAFARVSVAPAPRKADLLRLLDESG